MHGLDLQSLDRLGHRNSRHGDHLPKSHVGVDQKSLEGHRRKQSHGHLLEVG